MLTNTFRCPLKLYSENEAGDKHCCKCNKTVVDLRHQSDEAVEHLVKESGEFCGIIQSNRLSSASIGVTTLAASILTLSSVLSPFNHLQGQHPEKVKHIQSDSTRTLTGIVTDKETGESLPFVNVIVKQDEKVICGGTTDFDGNYTMNIINNDINQKSDIQIDFFSVGYVTQSLKVNQNNLEEKLQIELSFQLNNDIVGMIMYAPPLIDKYDLSSGATIKGHEIRRMPRN